MAEGFLTEGWFAALRTAAAEHRCDHGGEARLHLHVEGAPTPVVTLAVAGGALTEAHPGAHGSPDLELRMAIADARAILSGAVDGTEALRLVAVAGPGDGAPSPLDLRSRPELDDLPAIPGADLDVQYRYSAGPWGPVDFGLSFRSGRVAEVVLGEVDEPDVEVACTFLQMAQVRRGDIGILDVLIDGGRVAGSEGALALLGGISESPEFRSAEQACGPSGRVLGILGQYHATCLGPALRAVAAETDALPGVT